jgi:cytidine deaminase
LNRETSPLPHPKQEFAGEAIGFSIHAEQAAFANAALAREPALTDLATSAAPCGHCRQFLCELGPLNRLTVHTPKHSGTLAELLPREFGPSTLSNSSETALAHAAVRLRAVAQPQCVIAGKDAEGWRKLLPTPSAAEAKAAVAAQAAYAPYTGAYSAVCLVLRDGQLLEGLYVESVAFNPSLLPLQCGLVNLSIHGKSPEDIVACVLAERVQEQSVSHREATRALLSAIAPDAALYYLPLELRASRGGGD